MLEDMSSDLIGGDARTQLKRDGQNMCGHRDCVSIEALQEYVQPYKEELKTVHALVEKLQVRVAVSSVGVIREFWHPCKGAICRLDATSKSLMRFASAPLQEQYHREITMLQDNILLASPGK